MFIKNQDGATVVEFAIIAPVLFLLIFGIIEFSLLLYNKGMLNNAAREASRAGVIYFQNLGVISDPNDDTYYPDDTLIKQIVVEYIQNKLLTFGSDVFDNTHITVTPPFVDRNKTGIDLNVRVEYRYNFLIIPNFVSNLAGGVNLVENVVMKLE